MFRFPFLIFIVITAAIAQMPDCSKTESCFYVRTIPKAVAAMQKTSAEECEKLNGADRVWKLVKLNSRQDVNRVAPKIGNQSTKFWIGLVRDESTSPDESANLTEWKGRSKWRWMLDGSALDAEVESWWLFREKDGRMENCVVGDWKWEASDKYGITFDARPCDTSGLDVFSSALLVCESLPPSQFRKPRRSIQGSQNRSIPQIQTSPPPPMSKAWIWIMIGIVLGLLVTLGLLAGLMLYFDRRKQGELKKEQSEKSKKLNNDSMINAGKKSIVDENKSTVAAVSIVNATKSAVIAVSIRSATKSTVAAPKIPGDDAEQTFEAGEDDQKGYFLLKPKKSLKTGAKKAAVNKSLKMK